jgi:integrase
VERAEPRKDKFLTSEEIKAIESVILPKHLARVRDMFIFSVYTGLAFSDMLDFSKDKVVEFDGELVIDGERLKDGVQYIIPLVSQAKACLDRQNWDFGTISNAKYNEYIKVVAARAKVDKPISSHWARHTAGMLMLNNGVPIEIVSRVLGHANISTTQRVYAHVRMKAVVREVKKFQQSI